MMPKVDLAVRPGTAESVVYLVRSLKDIPAGVFTAKETSYIRQRKEKEKQEWIPFNRLGRWEMVQFIKQEEDPCQRNEWLRKAGDRLQGFLNEHKAKTVYVAGRVDPESLISLAEGMALGCYRYLKFKTVVEEHNTLETIRLVSSGLRPADIRKLNAVIEGVYFARDLVNEPNSSLNTRTFGSALKKMGKSCGVEVEIFNRNKLEALQMGGILGVNQGSHEPPAMIVLEYKPGRIKNKNPLVLVGKGIMFDSGGMNLKPGDSMNDMKDDMSGGAAVAGAIFALARAGTPAHVIGLIPATDNRPGEKAIVSGDILKMHNGKTVEVINTDAEGRLILADALSYAARYKPGLVINLATLTGSAIRAIGKRAMAGMQSGAAVHMKSLVDSGFAVFERIVELPLWEDYGEGLKSEVADMKNLAGPEAGTITAGKFLEKFVSYPFIHLDIAGPAFLEKRDGYRPSGGTGAGVRLLFHFAGTKL